MEATKVLDLEIFRSLFNKQEERKQKFGESEYEWAPFEFRSKIVWFNALGFLAMHLIGLYGIGLAVVKFFCFEWGSILWTSALVFLAGEGITMGAHRLWTHKTFKAKLPLEIILLTLQTLAGENCLYIWCRDHRQHHKFTDTDADPHNASRGFFFSHIGWLMMKKHPDVIKMGKTVDMSDLEANPLCMFQKKWYKPLYTIIALIIPVVAPIYFWNEDPYFSFIFNFFTRTVVLLNITWSVNSVAHIFGYRPYDNTMLPVESFFVSFITLGEGWHNYHHAFPWDYKAAEWGTGYNSTRTFIELFHKLGWAYDLREASQTVINSKAARLGDGTHVPAPKPDPTIQLEPSPCENLCALLAKATHNEDDDELAPVALLVEESTEAELQETILYSKGNQKLNQRKVTIKHA